MKSKIQNPKSKILRTTLALATLALLLPSTPSPAPAQTADTNLPPHVTALSGALDSLHAGSNFMVATYAIASADLRKFGAGLAIAYKLSDFVAPVVRLDGYDHSLWLPSGSLQLQVPITFGQVKIIPFAFSGLATPISGNTHQSLVGLFGTGAALQISKRWDLIGDYERWTGLGDQIRFGALYKF